MTAFDPAFDWSPHVNGALGVLDEGDGLWRQAAPARYSRTDFLREATYNLRRVYLVTFRAGMTLLADPMVAYGADPLLRVLLEVWAHLAWIEYGESRSQRIALGRHHAGRMKKGAKRDRSKEHCFSDARFASTWSTEETRALCWLMGDSASYQFAARQAHPSLRRGNALRQSRERTARYRLHHQNSGCPGGRGRDYADAEPMLRLLSHKYHFPWIVAYWRSSSASAHGARAMRLVRVPGGNVVDGPLPDFEHYQLIVRFLQVFMMSWMHILNLSDRQGALASQEFSNVVAPKASALCQALEAMRPGDWP
jgi:hypothetical protein